jgi:hypothetical protein
MDLHAIQPMMRRLPVAASLLFIGIYMVSDPSAFNRHGRQLASVLRSVHLRFRMGWPVAPGVEIDRWPEHRLGIRMAGVAVALLGLAVLVTDL